jgi:hypothetical protein
MNIIGYMAMAGFIAMWACGVICWFVAAYHMALAHVRYWQSKPSVMDILSGVFWFLKGPSGLREAWEKVPDGASVHFRKSFKAGVVFVGCVIIAMGFGLIGSAWGAWPK